MNYTVIDIIENSIKKDKCNNYLPHHEHFGSQKNHMCLGTINAPIKNCNKKFDNKLSKVLNKSPDSESSRLLDSFPESTSMFDEESTSQSQQNHPFSAQGNDVILQESDNPWYVTHKSEHRKNKLNNKCVINNRKRHHVHKFRQVIPIHPNKVHKNDPKHYYDFDNTFESGMESCATKGLCQFNHKATKGQTIGTNRKRSYVENCDHISSKHVFEDFVTKSESWNYNIITVILLSLLVVFIVFKYIRSDDLSSSSKQY